MKYSKRIRIFGLCILFPYFKFHDDLSSLLAATALRPAIKLPDKSVNPAYGLLSHC